MAKKFLSNIDLNKNELQNAVIQPLASAPSSPVEGQIYYNTGDDTVYVWANGVWLDLGTQGGGGIVETIVAGNNIDVDSTDPTNPIVSVETLTPTDIGVTASVAELDILDGATLSTTELNYVDGVTSAIQTQLDAKSTASKTETLTNKTIDANGTGNSITNLETADFAAGVISTNTALGSSDTVLPTQNAVKTYVDNSTQGLSWKQAVRVATTVAGTLATSFENSDTVDGVTLATGDRILIKNQADATENGIYVVAASGAPARAADANTGAELRAATVYVEEGTANADTVWNQTTNATITIGSTNIVFAQVNGGTVPAASTTVAGKVELATQAEAEARTDTDRAVTPVSLVNFPVKKTFTVGDNSATSIALTHSLGTKEVITQVRQASDDAIVECDIVNTSTSVTTLTFAVAPATNAIKAVVMG